MNNDAEINETFKQLKDLESVYQEGHLEESEWQEKMRDIFEGFSPTRSNKKAQILEMLGRVLKQVNDGKDSKSKIVGKVNLIVQENGDATVLAQVFIDDKAVEPVRELKVSLDDYPNLATELPILYLLALYKYELHWEMIIKPEVRGFYSRFATDKSQLTINKLVDFSDDPDGVIVWGDGKGGKDLLEKSDLFQEHEVPYIQPLNTNLNP